MRDTNTPRRKLRSSFKEYRPEIEEFLHFKQFCDIELGLFLLHSLSSGARADSLWTLLTGYPFPIPELQHFNQNQRKMLANARHILTQYRTGYNWSRGLKRYLNVSERLRGYAIDEDLNLFSQRDVSVCSKRFQVYQNTLNGNLEHSKQKLEWISEPGAYICNSGKHRDTVDIPQELIFPPPVNHDLTPRSQRQAITVTWEDLLETASWMDSILYPEIIASGDESKLKLTWNHRISRVVLELVGEDGRSLILSKTLTIEGLIKLIGMVSYGKSTLMIVLSVLLARRGLNVTIVVGDVIAALEQAKIFDKLGISVDPVLGASNRDKHLNRLHRAWNSQNSKQPLNLEHPGFQWLSTTCPLSELRRDVARPFKMREYPCIGLTDLNRDEEREEEESENVYACPIYSGCPFHQAQRDLVKAQVWIATPASLIYTRVASQINRESIRFLELVYRRSDLIIVDEVDQVQVQLDSIFCPNQKLFGAGGDGWFSKVQQPVIEQLNLQGRKQLADDDTDDWTQAHATAQVAIDRIYRLLLENPSALKKWSERGDYFTYWLILSEVTDTLCGTVTSNANDNWDSQRLLDIFGDYIDDPLGDYTNHPLCEIGHKLLLANNKDLARQNLREWIINHPQFNRHLNDRVLDNTVVKMEFALLVAVLQKRFNWMLRDWKLAEEVYKLEEGNSLLFHTPPRDYEPVVPTAPMGNILAFQYLRSTEEAPGDLRFFKCLGVGRWLLLHLHELYAAEGITGPNVLFLSGTSWAGLSPGYHVQVPVAGVLRSPEEELQAIRNSKFRFEPYFYDDSEQPIRISGSKDKQRDTALKELLNKLAQQNRLGGPSKLEDERAKLPKSRQRILLLVSSYKQAELAQEHLIKTRPEWQEQVMRLVCDDDEFETGWCGSGQSIQRGLVSKFPSTEAWILIAPLMAIERGHNILNEVGKAAFGAAYFLVRPHPRPDDINFAIHSINRWAVEKHNDVDWLTNQCEDNLLTVDKVGQAFLDATYRQWRYLLRLPMIYSTLPPKQREAVIWNQLVSIWQVIGRLIRGGSPARVIFCDAAFALNTAHQDEQGDTPQSSLLVGMQEVLRPYFSSKYTRGITRTDKALVQAPYEPFYNALENIQGI